MMSRSAASGYAFGIYALVLGASVVAAPNAVIGLVGLAPTSEVWLRVAGVLAAAIGYYYLRACAAEDRSFLRGSVHGRLGTALAFGAFVALRLAPWQLLLFAAVDLPTAIWTAWALRSDERGAT
jgi:hypothetical protein